MPESVKARSRRKADSVESVLGQLQRKAAPTRSRGVWVSVMDSLGRIPSEEIRARRLLPPTDQSTMDGFAVRLRSAERRGIAPFGVRKVVGRSAPGNHARARHRIGFDTAVEVLTGAKLPSGSNAVIRSENVRRVRNRIWIREPVTAGHDIARQGEDFRPHSRLVAAGTRIRPWHVAAFVANEIARVRVVRMPQVGLLASGTEIVPASRARRGQGVRDTTKPLLVGMLEELGISSVDLGVVSDDDRALRSAIAKGLARCDLLITIGGSGEGRRDRVPEAISAIRGARWIARRVRLRPGSTSSIALVRRRPVFVLAGPPVAAFAGFHSLVEPFLRSRGLVARPARATITAQLDHDIDPAPGVRELMRVRIRHRNGVHHVSVLERRGSARLSSLTGADGLLELEGRRKPYRAGDSVDVLLFDEREASSGRRVR